MTLFVKQEDQRKIIFEAMELKSTLPSSMSLKVTWPYMPLEHGRSNYYIGLHHRPESFPMTRRARLEAALGVFVAEALSGEKSRKEALRVASSYLPVLRLVNRMDMGAEVQEADHVSIATTEEFDAGTSPALFSPRALLLKETSMNFSSHHGEERYHLKHRAHGIMGMMDSYMQRESSFYSNKYDVHEIHADSSDVDSGYGSDDESESIQPLDSGALDEQEGELFESSKWNEQKPNDLGYNLKRWEEWFKSTVAITQAKMMQCPAQEDRERLHLVENCTGFDIAKYQDAEESNLSPDEDQPLDSLNTVDEHELLRPSGIVMPTKIGGPSSASRDSRSLVCDNGRLFGVDTGSGESSHGIGIVQRELRIKVDQNLPSWGLPASLLAAYHKPRIDIAFGETMDLLRRLYIEDNKHWVKQALVTAKPMNGRKHKSLRLQASDQIHVELHKGSSIREESRLERIQPRAGCFRVAKRVGPRPY